MEGRALAAAIFIFTTFQGVSSSTTLTVTSSAGCPALGTSNSIPTGSGVTVTMVCDLVNILTVILADTGASVVFKKDGTTVYQLETTDTVVTDAAEEGVMFSGATPVAVITPSDNSDDMQLTITNFPSGAVGSWTCEVIDDAITGIDYTQAPGSAQDLSIFCATCSITECSDPPSVSNGDNRYTGPYINGSKAEYDCNEGYTNTGAPSMLCQVQDNPPTCTTSWVDDPVDSLSGLPVCDINPVTDFDIINNYDQTLDNWLYWLVLGSVLFLLLLLLVLLLWWCCCREPCRYYCMSKCPGCCHYCCDDIPYADSPRARGKGYRVLYQRYDEETRQQHHHKMEPRDLVYLEPLLRQVNTRGDPVWTPLDDHQHNY